MHRYYAEPAIRFPATFGAARRAVGSPRQVRAPGPAVEPGAADEAALVRSAQTGDAEAAGLLARRYWTSTWKTAYAIVRSEERADDAVQDTFERLFRHLGRVDPDRPLAPWLHRIVVNCSLSILRRDRDDRAEALVEEPEDGGQEARLEATRDVRELLDALWQLDPDRRVVVVVRLILGYAPKEAAEMLGIAVGTVNSRLSRALKELRTALDA